MGRASFAEEASAPGTPSAGFVTLYFLAAGSGIPIVKDDAGTVQTVVLLEAANVFTAAQKIDVSSAMALVVEDDGVNDNTLVIDTSTPGVGMGIAVPTATLHVDQAAAAGAMPVLLLDQADVSEEMVEFASTIGVGNAIEAVGAKTLTVTHFIKVTLPGPLTRYIQVGTIA